jgi:hypothetical protein
MNDFRVGDPLVCTAQHAGNNSAPAGAFAAPPPSRGCCCSRVYAPRHLTAALPTSANGELTGFGAVLVRIVAPNLTCNKKIGHRSSVSRELVRVLLREHPILVTGAELSAQDHGGGPLAVELSHATAGKLFLLSEHSPTLLSIAHVHLYATPPSSEANRS